jgi:hypothetical protein
MVEDSENDAVLWEEHVSLVCHWVSIALASNASCIVGNAMVTAVSSMNAMLEPKGVATTPAVPGSGCKAMSSPPTG